MTAQPAIASSSSAGGYASAEYAAALVDLGRPDVLPASGASILVAPVPGSPWTDARGPYPLLVAPRWQGLREDLDGLAERRDSDRDPVSVVAVVTPFCECGPRELRRAFPDLAVPYKEHFVVELASGSSAGSRHHDRNVRKALSAVAVELVEQPGRYIDEWCRLYDELRRRHGISGAADFSRDSLARQLAVPGLTAFRATVQGRPAGMTLWVETADVGYYHLGAYSSLGYEAGASFALFATAIAHFRSSLDWLDLGAGAGTRPAESGLTRFKQGWATGTRAAYLCGRVLDRSRYDALVASHGTAGASFFPSYRAPAS